MMGGPAYIVNRCCAIILAAGGSSRLGEPKQLLRFKGKTLLQHTIDEALRADLQPVVLVTGGNSAHILQHTDCRRVKIAINPKWHTGMASSVLTGMSTLAGITPAPDGVLLLACDQPLVTFRLLDEMLEKQRSTGNPIVNCVYDGVSGVPALFHESCFAALRGLQGDAGARHLIRSHPGQVSVPFPGGSLDIDTAADYERLLRIL